jgi:hypothetical protein
LLGVDFIAAPDAHEVKAESLKNNSIWIEYSDRQNRIIGNACAPVDKKELEKWRLTPGGPVALRVRDVQKNRGLTNSNGSFGASCAVAAGGAVRDGVGRQIIDLAEDCSFDRACGAVECLCAIHHLCHAMQLRGDAGSMPGLPKRV